MKVALILILATGTMLSAHPEKDWKPGDGKIGYYSKSKHRDGSIRSTVSMPEPSSLMELSLGGIAIAGMLLLRKRA
jgi:hypothetical protein